MKINSLIVASGIFLVLAGIFYWSEHRKPADESVKASADTPPAILKLNEATITRLDIRKKNEPAIQLAKADSGTWRITQPRLLGADPSTVSGVLSSLASLTSERLVDDKASDLKRYGLDQPSIEVDIAEADNKTQKLLIGDETPTGSASYAMLAGDPRVFTLANYNKTSVAKSLNDLRDKRLLTLSADKISRIELVRKNQEIEFGRNKDQWQILKPKPMRADGLQVDELERKLTDARMELSGSEDNSKEAEAAFARGTPVATAKVTDESGTQELQVRKSKDTYCARSSMVEGAYKVGSEIGQGLEKSLDDFRNKKLFDFGFNDPNKVELHSGAKAYFLTRSGEDWWSNGKKMDAISAEGVVSKLRELAATKFPDAGFTKPEIEITVTSDDNKRVETVSIAKSGNSYIAVREKEPALYQLHAGSIDELLKAADGVKPASTAAK
jgi:hypothetical protein